VSKKTDDACAVVVKPFSVLKSRADCRLMGKLVTFAVDGIVRGRWLDVSEFEADAGRQRKFACAFGIGPLPPIPPDTMAMLMQIVAAMLAAKGGV
jgi:hypothetical protein